MKVRRHKRENAETLGRGLKRRFYKGAAVATVTYVVLSLIKFHGQLGDLPSELAIIWAVFLLCYTTTKEIFRWSDVGDDEIYHGELWVGVMLAGAAWMIGWNIVRAWAYHLPKIPFPSDYESAVVETIVLYTLSIASSYLYKYKKLKRLAGRQKSRKPTHPEPKPLLTPNIAVTGATVDPKQDVKVVLTKTSTLDEKNPPQGPEKS